MKGSLSHAFDAGLPAGEVWAVYGSLELAKLAVKLLPDVVYDFELVQGDGGVGSVLKLTFRPGNPGPQCYKEKFVKIDDEKRVKEALVVEGGYLEVGFSSYLVRFEIIEKDSASSIIRSTIEYEISDELAANASLVSTGALAAIAEAITKHLIEKKARA